MTAREIAEKLESHFHDHRYPLENVYLFRWESDFLSVTKEGLVYEFEIKLSKSDFKADFKKKDKHRILNSFNKGGLSIRRNSEHRDYERVASASTFEIPGRFKKDQMDIVSRWYTDIQIENICQCAPNRFYYCCPPGIITPDRLPPYAGLIEIADIVTIIRRAPPLHKAKISFSAGFLDKYFWKYRNIKNQHKILLANTAHLQDQVNTLAQFIRDNNLEKVYEDSNYFYLYDLPKTNMV